MNTRTLVWIAGIAGLVFVALALYYWFTPAGSLAQWVPGYIEGSADIHIKHGLASLILGVLSFVYVWFQSA